MNIIEKFFTKQAPKEALRGGFQERGFVTDKLTPSEKASLPQKEVTKLQERGSIPDLNRYRTLGSSGRSQQPQKTETIQPITQASMTTEQPTLTQTQTQLRNLKPNLNAQTIKEKYGVLRDRTKQAWEKYKDLNRATTQYQIEQMTTPPSKHDYLALAFLPAFASGSYAQQESKYVYDNILKRYVTRKEMEKLAQQRFSQALSQSKDIKVYQGQNVVTEGELREATRRILQKNANDPTNLNKLKKFYTEAGRKDLYDDIFNQEIKPFLDTKPSLKVGSIDKPTNIEASSTITSQTAKIYQPKQSEYYGTGQYERTEAITPRAKPTQKTQDLTFQTQDDILQYRTLGTQKQRPLLTQPQTQPQATKLDQMQRQQQKQEQEQKPRQQQSPFFKYRTGQATAQQQQQQQRQKNKQDYYRPFPRMKPKPKVPKKFFPFLSDYLPEEKRKKKKKDLNLFFPEVKEFGKWKPIGEFRSLKKAKSRGIGELRGTLRASLRIKKGKELIPFVKSTPEFRPSKKTPKRVLVQRRSKRLSSPFEVYAIQRARKFV